MSLEFFVWLLGVAASNFLITVPLYVIVSTILHKLVKNNVDLKVFSVSFGLVMFLMIMLQSFTIANMVTMFLELLLLNWIGDILYFDSKKQSYVRR